MFWIELAEAEISDDFLYDLGFDDCTLSRRDDIIRITGNGDFQLYMEKLEILLTFKLKIIKTLFEEE